MSWKRVVKDDCVRSCLIELKAFLLSKFDVKPIHRVLMFLPYFLLVPSKTRSIQVNFIWILMFLVHWIHRREEYHLPFAQILSSWYQSWVHDGEELCKSRDDSASYAHTESTRLHRRTICQEPPSPASASYATQGRVGAVHVKHT